ncbi:1899_t:CDS:10 [Cetraspora pellucida]|uniref:1899_t:CDS:1 n=1 Tax=Cetraspora pellucida TaxID=1433469 RepID=A0ACA9L9C1_9GLOM|nr:1899_t:CDS:10 [Cetraspora pellucida]
MSSVVQEKPEYYSVGILTVSDTCSRDSTKDLSGPALKTLFSETSHSKKPFRVIKTKIVKDDSFEIQKSVKDWCDVENLDLVVTTGGTGFGIRDVTPEAVQPLFEKSCTGVTHAMIKASLEKTIFAALSRPVCGIRGNTIILTVPGSPKGAKENIQAILNVLPHAIDLVRDETGENVHAQLRVEIPQRQRKSPYPMISVTEALNIITEHSNTLSPIKVPVDENLIGMVLAEDVVARLPVPGYRASILDGYVVVASDGPGIYPVVGVSIANTSNLPADKLLPGQIARITTGGPVPPGATAVVMVEDTTLIRASADGLQEESVEIHVKVNDGANIREIGSDTSVGSIVARKGEILSAVGGEIGVLASVGVKEVCVYRRPVIGVLSTGNEVIDHKNTLELKYGQIFDSNRPTLFSIAKATGFEVKDFGIVDDDPKELEKTLKTALTQVDVLVSTGGVSMGELDLFKPTLEKSLGATIHFGRVKMKPGKPTTFATLSGTSGAPEKLIFGLPGNPVSATVTFYLFVLPALRKLAGYENWNSPILPAELTDKLSLDPRPEYHRAVISFDHSKGKFIATSTGHQISSRMLSLRSCNALLKLPEKTDQCKELDKGSTVDAILIGQLS